MAQQDICKLIGTHEDSDSDTGGVLLDHSPKIVKSQKMAEIQFTFRMPALGTISLSNLIILYCEMEKGSPHDHNMPTVDCFVFNKPRNYTLLKNVDCKTSLALRSSSSVMDLTEFLNHTTLDDNGHREMSPRQIDRFLRRWIRNDPGFAQECRERHEKNPFPNIDMNVGWNRARYQLETFFDGLDNYKGTEERLRIREEFAGFSLSRQLQPLVLPEESLREKFEGVFVGCGCDRSGWAREPGSWWGARKRVFFVGRRDWCGEGLKKAVRYIQRRVDIWLDEGGKMEGDVLSLKRTYPTFADEATENKTEVLTLVRKKRQIVGWKSEEVMSDAWRARRRLQEKKAGRWTDGTLRMDRLWGEFHWVLNMDDPKEMKW